MKDSKLRKLATILLLLVLNIACSAKSTTTLSWDSGGNVVNDAGQHLKVDLQNVYKGLHDKEGLFLLGFKIDEKGINYTTLVWVSKELKNPSYWTFEDDLQDLFLYKNKVYLLARNGSTFNLKNDSWVKVDLQLKPDSIVLSSREDIIACYPSPLLKTKVGVGGCYSVDKNWSVNLNWTTITPKICDGYLVAVDQQNSQKMIKQISLEKGEITATKRIEKDIEDLCLATL